MTVMTREEAIEFVKAGNSHKSMEAMDEVIDALKQIPRAGRKYDQNKVRLDLIPPEVILELGKILTYGAKKYAPNNWQKLSDFEDRYYAAALRHLMAWRMGEEYDGESGLRHISHALTCLAFLTWKAYHSEEKN